MKTAPRFSSKTILFLKKAGRQKRPDWLERNRQEYEHLLREPLAHLAQEIIRELGPQAPDYHFPQKGIGRLKRPTFRSQGTRGSRDGRGLYKTWVSYSASRPRSSRFERHPSLFFMIDSEDPKDSVLVAGGLYMPSSRQLRSVREAISREAEARIFDHLFATPEFSKCFPGGFSDEKKSTRPPRGFGPDHPRLEWLKLQAFFVWRSYSLREFASKDFPSLVIRDWKQILRLNRLLEKALQRGPSVLTPNTKKKKPIALLEQLEGVEVHQRKMDF